MLCKVCGIREVEYGLLVCPECIYQDAEEKRLILILYAQGHTRHCACRQVWGDGECECGRVPFTTA